MEDLLNLSVTVASQKASTVRETPGIITVITEDEIKGSGARDFIDLMKLVPGFDFGVDIDNQIGMGVRGNWANEGKMLIMIDGIAQNETSYGSYFFQDHILLDNIKRIEIIRGPGSAIYGGLAGLAVINIITRTGNEINGVSAQANYGMSNSRTQRTNVSLSVGKKLSNGFEFGLSGFMNKSNYNNFTMNDYAGTPINYGDSSGIKNYNINSYIAYKGIKLRYTRDEYQQQRIEASEGVAYTSRNNVQAEYDWKIGNKLTIKPKFLWQNSEPWSINQSPVEQLNLYYNFINNRYTGSVSASYDVHKNVNLLGGLEYFSDDSYFKDKDSIAVFPNGNRYVQYQNFAAYAQASLKTKIVDLTIGARYNKNSVVNEAFVPRIGLTKTYNKFHFKLLYSMAFKAPVIQNMAVTPNIKPENFQVIELETGLKLSPKMFITTNIYDIKITNPIIYQSDPLDYTVFDYVNYKRAGTRGIEAEYKFKSDNIMLTASYSYYRNSSTQNASTYIVPGDSSLLLGFPAHKLALAAQIKLGKHLLISPSMIYNSKKYTLYYDVVNDITSNIKVSDMTTLNLYICYKDLLTKGLTLGVGAYNILGEKLVNVNPYDAGVNYTPLAGREFLVRLSYKL